MSVALGSDAMRLPFVGPDRFLTSRVRAFVMDPIPGPVANCFCFLVHKIFWWLARARHLCGVGVYIDAPLLVVLERARFPFSFRTACCPSSVFSGGCAMAICPRVAGQPLARLEVRLRANSYAYAIDLKRDW